jgi:hypothetical protein
LWVSATGSLSAWPTGSSGCAGLREMGSPMGQVNLAIATPGDPPDSADLRGRRGESRRARDHARLGQPGIALHGGDSEIGDDRLTLRADQHVARLDIPVQNASRVRGAQCIEQAQAKLRSLSRRQRTVLRNDLV